MTALTKGIQSTNLEIQAKLWANFGLTLRQREVASLVCEGLKSQQIAAMLFITEKAVKYHITNIYVACKVSGRKELIALIDKLCKRG